MENLCAHCLESGDWEDEDKCPKCEASGHVSPWRVSACPACNKEFFDKMKEIGSKQSGSNKQMSEPVTLEWLHSIDWLQTKWPEGWKNCTRGIVYANWTIHTVQSRPMNIPVETWEEAHGYDLGPFVWSVMPTHGQNMIPLEKPRSTFTILVLKDRRDVMLLLELLGRD